MRKGGITTDGTRHCKIFSTVSSYILEMFPIDSGTGLAMVANLTKGEETSVTFGQSTSEKARGKSDSAVSQPACGGRSEFKLPCNRGCRVGAARRGS